MSENLESSEQAAAASAPDDAAPQEREAERSDSGTVSPPSAPPIPPETSSPPRAPVRYRRLASGTLGSPGIAVSGRGSLWRGPDHLLLVWSTGYTEEYKRFFFRDIEAFIVRPTATGVWIAIGFGALSIPFVWGIVASHMIAWQIFCAVMLASTGIPFLLNLAFGPTCHCAIRTHVQVAYLPPLGRLRKCLRIIRLLTPLIEAAQGDLPAVETVIADPEARSKALSVLQEPTTTVGSGQESRRRYPQPTASAPRTGWLHALGIALTMTGIGWLSLLIFPVTTYVPGAVVVMLTMASIVVPIVFRLKGGERTVGPLDRGRVRLAMWWLVGACGAVYGIFSVLIGTSGSQLPFAPFGAVMRSIHSAVHLDPDDGPFFLMISALTFAAAVMSIVLGFLTLRVAASAERAYGDESGEADAQGSQSKPSPPIPASEPLPAAQGDSIGSRVPETEAQTSPPADSS